MKKILNLPGFYEELFETLRSYAIGNEPAILVVTFGVHCETLSSHLAKSEAVVKLQQIVNARGIPLGFMRGFWVGGQRELMISEYPGLPDPEMCLVAMEDLYETIIEDYRRKGTLPQTIRLTFAPRKLKPWLFNHL